MPKPEPKKVEFPSESEEIMKVEKGGVDAETTKWQLSPEEIIADMSHHLRGEEWDPSKGKHGDWNQVLEEPMLNEKGVQRTIWKVKNFLNKNSQLSWFSDQQIAKTMRYFRKELARLLRRNRKEFDIDRNDLSEIHMAVSQTVWAALNRARLGGEKEFIRDTEKRTVQMRQGGKEEGEGILSKLNPF